MSAADAAKRIEKALEGKTLGFRGPNDEIEHVQLVAGDIIEVCTAVHEQDEIVQALLKGSQGAGLPTKKVVIQADHAFHLLEQFTPAPVMPVKTI